MGRKFGSANRKVSKIKAKRREQRTRKVAEKKDPRMN